MEEARPRFAEAAQLVTTALRDEVFEWDGEFYKIPKMSIRPRPMSNPERRFYASSVSPDQPEIMAKLGFGMMVIMQNEWSKAAADIHDYRSIAESVGHNPPPPVVLTNVSCADTRDEAGNAPCSTLAQSGILSTHITSSRTDISLASKVTNLTARWRRPTPN